MNKINSEQEPKLNICGYEITSAQIKQVLQDALSMHPIREAYNLKRIQAMNKEKEKCYITIDDVAYVRATEAARQLVEKQKEIQAATELATHHAMVCGKTISELEVLKGFHTKLQSKLMEKEAEFARAKDFYHSDLENLQARIRDLMNEKSSTRGSKGFITKIEELTAEITRLRADVVYHKDMSDGYRKKSMQERPIDPSAPAWLSQAELLNKIDDLKSQLKCAEESINFFKRGVEYYKSQLKEKVQPKVFLQDLKVGDKFTFAVHSYSKPRQVYQIVKSTGRLADSGIAQGRVMYLNTESFVVSFCSDSLEVYI